MFTLNSEEKGANGQDDRCFFVFVYLFYNPTYPSSFILLPFTSHLAIILEHIMSYEFIYESKVVKREMQSLAVNCEVRAGSAYTISIYIRYHYHMSISIYIRRPLSTGLSRFQSLYFLHLQRTLLPPMISDILSFQPLLASYPPLLLHLR